MRSARSTPSRPRSVRTSVAPSKKKASGSAKVTNEYPQATRQAPDGKASKKGTPQLQKMMKLYDDDKGPEARAIADQIIASADSNAYDKSFASQIAAQVAYDADDTPGAMKYLKQAIDFNGLDNNGHFGAMLMLSQLQLQEDQYAESLKTIDQFLAETKSQKPEHLIIKGNDLYRLERYTRGRRRSSSRPSTSAPNPSPSGSSC